MGARLPVTETTRGAAVRNEDVIWQRLDDAEAKVAELRATLIDIADQLDAFGEIEMSTDKIREVARG